MDSLIHPYKRSCRLPQYTSLSVTLVVPFTLPEGLRRQRQLVVSPSRCFNPRFTHRDVLSHTDPVTTQQELLLLTEDPTLSPR